MGVRIIGRIQDEIILEAAGEQVQEVGYILVAPIKRAGAFYLKEVPIEVDLSIAGNWSEKRVD